LEPTHRGRHDVAGGVQIHVRDQFEPVEEYDAAAEDGCGPLQPADADEIDETVTYNVFTVYRTQVQKCRISQMEVSN
jgi:hypothetical protein